MDVHRLEKASPADKSTPKMQGFNHVSKRQVGSLNELSYFFEELSSWREEREESHRRLDNLLSSYSGSIEKAVKSLIEEVGDLQAKNSIISMERNDLLAIVSNMSVEIEHPRVQYPIDNLVQEPKENLNQEEGSQETCFMKVELPHAKDKEGENKEDNIEAAIETHDETGFDDYVDQTMLEEKTGHGDVNPHLDQGTHKFIDKGVETVEHPVVVGQETNGHLEIINNEDKETLTQNKKQLKLKHSNTKNLTYENPVEKAGQGSTNTNLYKYKSLIKREISKRKSNPPRKGEAVEVLDIKEYECENLLSESSKIQNHTLMCKQCPYETTHKGHFLRHIQAHKDQTIIGSLGKKLMCDQCPYVASNKGYFLQHFKMHKDLNIKGGLGKKLICDQCPYETSIKKDLFQHSRVHNDIRNHMCEKCPYKAKCEDTLKYHIKAVHDNIRDLVCDRCGYATSRPSSLSEHKQTVHNTGEKKFLCDLCPYRAHMKKILAKHVKNVHKG